MVFLPWQILKVFPTGQTKLVQNITLPISRALKVEECIPWIRKLIIPSVWFSGAHGSHWPEAVHHRRGGPDTPWYLCPSKLLWVEDCEAAAERRDWHTGVQVLQHHDYHQVSINSLPTITNQQQIKHDIFFIRTIKFSPWLVNLQTNVPLQIELSVEMRMFRPLAWWSKQSAR